MPGGICIVQLLHSILQRTIWDLDDLSDVDDVDRDCPMSDVSNHKYYQVHH